MAYKSSTGWRNRRGYKARPRLPGLTWAALGESSLRHVDMLSPSGRTVARGLVAPGPAPCVLDPGRSRNRSRNP